MPDLADIDLVSQYSATSVVSVSRQTTEQRSLYDQVLTYPKLYEHYLKKGIDLMETKADKSNKKAEICHLCQRNSKDLYMAYEKWQLPQDAEEAAFSE